MNNHAQMNPAHERRGFDAVHFCGRWKVVMPIGAWLAIAGILLPAGLLGAEEAKGKAATPAEKQAGKKDPAKKKPVPKVRPAVRRVMRAQTPTSTVGNYLLVDLSENANDNFAQAIGKAPLHVGPVPFRLPQGDRDHLSLRQAQWNGWVVEAGRSPELEFYNFLTPRRKGDFAFQSVPVYEGQNGVLRVAPRPITYGKDTLPMYAVLAHKTGIPVPDTPTEIGLWINGNSGWGRVFFELTDASGQRWISIGAQSKEDPAKYLPKDVLAQLTSPGISDWNTEDPWGLSRINFDGWRYVAFPVPGNYPGERYVWPANSQWRWDKDGVVHYPLTLRKLVVELNEKVLHLRTFAPVPRPEIYLKNLVAAQGDTVRVKQTVGD